MSALGKAVWAIFFVFVARPYLHLTRSISVVFDDRGKFVAHSRLVRKDQVSLADEPVHLSGCNHLAGLGVRAAIVRVACYFGIRLVDDDSVAAKTGICDRGQAGRRRFLNPANDRPSGDGGLRRLGSPQDLFASL